MPSLICGMWMGGTRFVTSHMIQQLAMLLIVKQTNGHMTTYWLPIVATLKRKILCHMTILWLLHLKNVGVYIDCNRSCVLNMTPLTSYNKLLC